MSAKGIGGIFGSTSSATGKSKTPPRSYVAFYKLRKDATFPELLPQGKSETDVAYEFWGTTRPTEIKERILLIAKAARENPKFRAALATLIAEALTPK